MPDHADPLRGTRVVGRNWHEFEQESPEIAESGRRLLIGSDGVAIGFLATASDSGTPHLAPVCPVFCDGRLYLSAVTATPKVHDLRRNPRYSLHSFLGANDEEFQVRGLATEIESPSEREAVLSAIEFGSFDASHPIFHLAIARARWAYWEHAGEPNTRAVRRGWSADASGAE